MATTFEPQASLYETTIENAALESALEERQKLKEKAGQARKTYKEKDDEAKALINTLDLGDDAPVRIGRFIVSRKPVPSREVAFTTDPTTRLNIRPIPDLA